MMILKKNHLPAEKSRADSLPYWKRYYLKNAERLKARRMERYHADPQRELVRQGEWRRAHLDHVAAYCRARYWEDPDRFRKKARDSMKRMRARRKAERA